MRLSKRLLISIVFVVSLIVITALSGIALRPQSQAELQSKAINLISQRHGIPVENLDVIYSPTGSFPLTGKTVYSFDLVDNRSGDYYTITVDSSGNEVDENAVLTQELSAHTAQYGKMQAELANLLRDAPSDKTIQVIIELHPLPDTPEKPEEVDTAKNSDEWASLSEPQKEEATQRDEEYLARVDSYLALQAERATAPVIARFNGLGINVQTSRLFPILYGELLPATIREIENWAEVKHISVNSKVESELNVSRETIGANRVEGSGFDGSGVRIAVVEPGGRAINNQGVVNPFLQGIAQDQTLVASAANWHTSAVAGIIRNTSTLPINPGGGPARGIAPGATLWVGGDQSGQTSGLQNRSEAAANWRAKAINLSWGELNPAAFLTSNDRFYDRMVWDRRITIVKSSGNRGLECGANGFTTSPGLAYNVITVGNFYDQNTVAWDGDVMDGCSSFRNPSSNFGDREKPEVVAPGSFIISTMTNQPWLRDRFAGLDYVTGTSFAAPHVTGTAALILQRASNLNTVPEAVKAIIIASAAHNIEGESRLSERDGAGAISASWAFDVAGNFRGGWGSMDYTCSRPENILATKIQLTAGLRTRVVLTWSSYPDYFAYSFQPSADLNLQVKGPTTPGFFILSTSRDNTFEIVDFTPSVGGLYEIRIIKRRCDTAPRKVAYAYWQFH